MVDHLYRIRMDRRLFSAHPELVEGCGENYLPAHPEPVRMFVHPLILNLLKDERTITVRPPYAIIRSMFPPMRRIFPLLADRRRAAALNFLIVHSGLLICALFLLVGLGTAGDYSVSPDEASQRRTARANLEYILGNAQALEPLKYHDRVYGVVFELPLLLAERALGQADYYYIHRLRLTLTHLFFIIGAFFCYRLAYRLFDNRLLALFALLIFLLHPRIYAHSFFNSKDPVFLSMFSIALYLLERAFRRDTMGAFVLLGIAVGLLTNLRIMGVMLFPAVIVMRGLDLFYAGSGPERKHILLSSGLFILAAGLTLYAVTPYAWSNPGDYWLTSLNLPVNHPTVTLQLFRGEWILSDQLPPHYNVIWFGITTPPLLLLLGGLGAAVVLARGIGRPGALFPNARMRFWGLLLACFLLPPLAAALLGSNQSQDWRHFYFLYAPFCLLAAGGGGWLRAGLRRPGPGPAGGRWLLGTGLGLILLQLIQLHPLQYGYFNFLVDRAAPEQLWSQYDLDYLRLAYREGLEYLLESHPGETLTVRSRRLHRDLLPTEGLLPPAAGRRADYELIYQPNYSKADLAFNAGYRRRLYNNTLIVARPLDSARMTPEAIAAYQEIYRQAVAGEPIIRADYNVYRHGQRLTFVKENCRPDSRDAWFGAQLLPPDPELLPPTVAKNDDYFAYGLSNHRVRLGAACLAVIQLPAAARGDILLSQHHTGWPRSTLIWEELYSLSPPGMRERLARRRQGQPPAAPDAFAVFLEPAAGGGYRLLYAKADCAPAEYATPITLHIYPVNLADLPARHRDNGFDNRDFPLGSYGGRPGGECVAVYPLPEYPIAAIHTGQAGIWETNLYPPADPESLRATYAALSGRQPAARADFALYIQDNRLIYLRETCAAGDTAAGFFLHILPEDVSVLPPERQAAGFANLDFAFGRWGGSFDGKCLAAVPLPDYPVKEIRTGQYVPSQGEVWAVEWAVGR